MMNRFRLRSAAIAMLGTICLLACQAETSAQTTRVTANKIQDIPLPHITIIESFAKADIAQQTGDANALMSLANLLDDLGAAPLAGTENAAAIWALKASKTAGFKQDTLESYRGRTKGPAYRRHTILAGRSDEIKEIYYAAEPAVMTLSPSEKGALSWEVVESDSPSAPICSGAPSGDIQACRFTPLWTGQYQIKISNNSTQDVTYVFVTN